MTKSRRPEATVLPIHFEDRSGTEFERLCFAYLLRAFEWRRPLTESSAGRSDGGG